MDATRGVSPLVVSLVRPSLMVNTGCRSNGGPDPQGEYHIHHELGHWLFGPVTAGTGGRRGAAPCVRRATPTWTGKGLTPFPCRGFQNASRVESGAQQRFARPQQVFAAVPPGRDVWRDRPHAMGVASSQPGSRVRSPYQNVRRTRQPQPRRSIRPP